MAPRDGTPSLVGGGRADRLIGPPPPVEVILPLDFGEGAGGCVASSVEAGLHGVEAWLPRLSAGLRRLLGGGVVLRRASPSPRPPFAA